MLRAEIAQGHNYLPAGTDVLRAFTYPFEQVKVLIVGQDPYPTPGHAMGLSFSVAPGVAIPRSLQNIFAELESDIGAPRPSSGDLRKWSREGVCLLNRVLTVRPGAGGKRSPSARSTPSFTAGTMREIVCRLLQSCGERTLRLWSLASRECRSSSPPTPPPCPRATVSSVPDHFRGRMRCSNPRERARSIGPSELTGASELAGPSSRLGPRVSWVLSAG